MAINEQHADSLSVRIVGTALIAILATLLGYLALEVAYRAYSYLSFKRALEIHFANLAVDGTTSMAMSGDFEADPDIGYRYLPNHVSRRGQPWFNTWRTNSHGHVATKDYLVAKPEGEFRIAVIGDSFTANATNNFPWTEVTEELLNSSLQWRAFVGNRFTRVINFGLGGAGFEAFAAIAERKVTAYQPDIVVINFISDDVLRRLHTPLGLSRPRAAMLPEEIVPYAIQDSLNVIPWTSSYPELARAGIGAIFPGLLPEPPAIPLGLSPQDILVREQRMPSVERGVEVSARAIARIMALYPRALFIRSPLRDQLAGAKTIWDGLERKVGEKVPGWSFLDLKERFLRDYDPVIPADFASRGMSMADIAKLPFAERPAPFNWFFYPFDDHYSDFGTAKLAGYVAEHLIQSLVGNKAPGRGE